MGIVDNLFGFLTASTGYVQVSWLVGWIRTIKNNFQVTQKLVMYQQHTCQMRMITYDAIMMYQCQLCTYNQFCTILGSLYRKMLHTSFAHVGTGNSCIFYAASFYYGHFSHIESDHNAQCCGLSNQNNILDHPDSDFSKTIWSPHGG